MTIRTPSKKHCEEMGFKIVSAYYMTSVATKEKSFICCTVKPVFYNHDNASAQRPPGIHSQIW